MRTAVPMPTAIRDAAISPCGRYRYMLSRSWSGPDASLMIVMLNPSTADAEQDDPTIRKCIGFAQRAGFGSILVVNLFAYRATDPVDLMRAYRRGEDIVGPENYEHITNRARVHSAAVLCAWGSHATNFPLNYVERVTDILIKGCRRFTLGRTKWGEPRHPLMVPYAQSFMDWHV